MPQGGSGTWKGFNILLQYTLDDLAKQPSGKDLVLDIPAAHGFTLSCLRTQAAAGGGACKSTVTT